MRGETKENMLISKEQVLRCHELSRDFGSSYFLVFLLSRFFSPAVLSLWGVSALSLLLMEWNTISPSWL
jgi:hypothetical protein